MSAPETPENIVPETDVPADVSVDVAPATQPARVKPRTKDYRIGADDDDIRLDRWFKRHREDVPHALLARWARTGMVRIDGAKTGPERRISAGQVLTVPIISAAPSGAARVRRPAKILTDAELELAQSMEIFRDEAAIVLNKPPGLATQGGTGTTEHVDGLLDAFFDPDRGRPRLVHRLDKDTSGVLLVARSANHAAKFSRSFSGRSARKTYWAIVVGVPDIAAGQIDLPIAKQPGSGGEKMHVDEENGLVARTRYRMIERAGNAAAWIELQPLTGRTHQLRVHMAAIGHPIVGDGKYGGKTAFLTGSISRKMHLHARRLRIDSPAGTMIDVTAGLPHHFAETLASLGFEESVGDAMGERPEKIAPAPDAKIRTQAREARRARKGERRSRGDVSVAKPSGKAPPRSATKPDRPKGPPSKPGASKAGGTSPRGPARPRSR